MDQTGSRLLVEGKEIGFEDDLHGSIHTKDSFDRNQPDTVTVEFAIRSIDAAVHKREAVWHYSIRGDKVERVFQQHRDSQDTTGRKQNARARRRETFS